MRKILAAGLLVALQGCAVIDAYLMTKYDPNEYQQIADIRTTAYLSKESCGNPVQAKTQSEKKKIGDLYSELYKAEQVISKFKSGKKRQAAEKKKEDLEAEIAKITKQTPKKKVIITKKD